MRDFSRRNGNRVVNYIMKDFKHYNTDDINYTFHYKGKDYNITIHKEDIK